MEDTAVKRRFQRIKTQARVRMSAPITGGVPDSAEVRELGLGGCLVSTPMKIGVGRMVMLYLDLEGDEVSAVAKILYEYTNEEGSFNCGAEFLDVEEADFARLSIYINDRISDYSRERYTC
ncbi:PilZ domain-containing protein [bacterium]|nr:MAG: PilZ domain-containing protein [bacterium]